MDFTTAQKATFRSDIQAQSQVGQPLQVAVAAGNFDAVGAFYNATATPAFWVWRSTVSRADVYNSTSDLPSNWSWPTYKAQAVTEQNAWTQMFMGDIADFSQDNLRAGVVSIFSGSAPANAQQAHILAVGRRTVTRLEKLLAAGTGSTASPAKLGSEGTVTAQQCSDVFSGF